MSHTLRILILVTLLITSAQPASAQSPFGPSAPPSAPLTPNAAGWYDGLIQYSTITNCVSIIQGVPYQEYGMGTYTGFYANPEAGQPYPNSVYYVHVVIAGMGNACSGQRAYIDIQLPSNTSLAIDATNKVNCYYDNNQLGQNECPQTFQPSPYNAGAYWIPSADNANLNLWPIPLGRILEIQIPVRTTTTLTNSPVTAHVWAFDGNSSPWLRPQQGVYVFSSTPTVFYSAPSTISITMNSAYSVGYLYNYGLGGNGYFDLGTTTSYGLFTDGPAVIPAGNPGVGYKVWTDWTPFVLQPDTVYHWRLRFVGSNSQTYYGPDQTFRTLPDGRVTVGNGATASCTDAALSSALATAKEIRFDCGVLPITLTLSAKTINTNVTINGENKVTLNMANAGRHFTIQSGATLTLTQIALINGRATCGGAVNVAANAKVVLNEARLISNYSYAQGGAVCVNGTASIANTVFMSNTAVSHGGAIGNYGTTTINSSRFTGNNAGVNGGGIDMGGHVAVTNTTFSHNVGLRGGGINTYGGVLTVVGSSSISNTANWYGGGLSNDASVTTVSGSTFSDNVAKVMGGGLETSGVGTLTIVNSTISANRAITEGGGVYWYPGVSTGPITLLNSTLANNTAGVQGGNIYAGGSANATIMLKNTLLTQGTPNNCDAAISSQGNNLDSANSCGLGASGDKVNTNPKLGALQNNGGSTLTHALLAGSPAIDAGTNNGCPATDQRGTARPIDGDLNSSAICDIGAYEAPSSRSVYLPLIRR